MGGISTGQPIIARFAVKPTSSILTPRRTVDRYPRPMARGFLFLLLFPIVLVIVLALAAQVVISSHQGCSRHDGRGNDPQIAIA